MKLLRTTVPCSLTPFACLLPALLSGCSWIQTLHDNLLVSLRRTEAQATALSAMEVRVRMLYPDGAKTVGGAASYMLEPHSYRPAYRNTTSEIIAERTFINNFDNDPVPLYVAMQRLMGRDGQIILDRNRKLFTFRLRKPDEPGIAFADLSTTLSAPANNGAANNTASSQLTPAMLVPEHAQAGSPVSNPTLRASEHRAGQTGQNAIDNPALRADERLSGKPEDDANPEENREICHSIQFRNRSMLSAAVQEYFLKCGFNEVFWRLGEPGRYADYRLLQNINVSLPERHRDLVEFLQTRFGIKTLIHDNNRVEFYDEDYSL